MRVHVPRNGSSEALKPANGSTRGSLPTMPTTGGGAEDVLMVYPWGRGTSPNRSTPHKHHCSIRQRVLEAQRKQVHKLKKEVKKRERQLQDREYRWKISCQNLQIRTLVEALAKQAKLRFDSGERHVQIPELNQIVQDHLDNPEDLELARRFYLIKNLEPRLLLDRDPEEAEDKTGAEDGDVQMKEDGTGDGEPEGCDEYEESDGSLDGTDDKKASEN